MSKKYIYLIASIIVITIFAIIIWKSCDKQDDSWIILPELVERTDTSVIEIDNLVFSESGCGKGTTIPKFEVTGLTKTIQTTNNNQ